MVSGGAITRWTRSLSEVFRRDLGGLAQAIWTPSRIQPGLRAWHVHPPGGIRTIHLRIEADGSGVLMVDVADAIHLNPTAALVAQWTLDGESAEECFRALRQRFRGSPRKELSSSVARVRRLVTHLSTTTDACPTCGLTVCDRTPLFHTPIHAPYKADLALSYACNNACGHCYNPPRRRGMTSLDTEGWRAVLQKLADIGVPHVIFTGGEPTLFEGLETLVRASDALGLVSGMNTNGRRLAERERVDALARAGLDHVQITLGSCFAEVHDAMCSAPAFDETVRGIENCLAAGLHTITNTTLTRRNVEHGEPLVDFLHGLGLRTFAANGMIHSGCGRGHRDALAEEDLAPALARIRDRAEELGMRFLWYTPTAYCRLSPVELELGPRRCNGGEYSICIEPNGDVLPCQSYYTPAGNLLRDPWPSIWDSPLFCRFRRRAHDPAGCGLPRACWECPDLPLCGGGCPLEREQHESGGKDSGIGQEGSGFGIQDSRTNVSVQVLNPEN